MKDTDVAVPGTICTIARQVLYPSRYGKYRHQCGKSWREYVYRLANTVTPIALSIIKQHLRVPDHVSVRITYFKGNKAGQYRYMDKQIEVKPSHSIERFVAILAHEATHADQFNTGRLGVTGSSYLWLTELEVPTSRQAIYDKYWNFPWEVEAREFATKLTPIVMSELRKDGIVPDGVTVNE